MAWNETSGLCSPIQLLDYTSSIAATLDLSTDAAEVVIEEAQVEESPHPVPE